MEPGTEQSKGSSGSGKVRSVLDKIKTPSGAETAALAKLFGGKSAAGSRVYNPASQMTKGKKRKRPKSLPKYAKLTNKTVVLLERINSRYVSLLCDCGGLLCKCVLRVWYLVVSRYHEGRKGSLYRKLKESRMWLFI